VARGFCGDEVFMLKFRHLLADGARGLVVPQPGQLPLRFSAQFLAHTRAQRVKESVAVGHCMLRTILAYHLKVAPRFGPNGRARARSAGRNRSSEHLSRPQVPQMKRRFPPQGASSDVSVACGGFRPVTRVTHSHENITMNSHIRTHPARRHPLTSLSTVERKVHCQTRTSSPSSRSVHKS
jgi:hypothetical protein